MGELPKDDDAVVDVLVSARGTLDQLAGFLVDAARHVAQGKILTLNRGPDGNRRAPVGEYDVLNVTPGKPRLSNRAILKADAMGLLDAAQAEPEASESAMRGEGEMAGGL